MYHNIFTGNSYLINVIIVYAITFLKVAHELSELLPES